MSAAGRRARDLAAAVRAGETSAESVLRDHLDHIDAHEADIRAFTTLATRSAREQAAEIDRAVADGAELGPLAGVPVSLKDNIVTEGIETTAASAILRGWIPPYDATVARRIRDAGAILVGKANLDEFAMGSSTESSVHGPTRNPVDTDRIPGGSSGGSAAAVAADFTPLSVGTDTGGSVRQPASHCGIVGVKPTYGRVSRHGLIALGSSLEQAGAMGADLADTALLHDVMVGPDPADATTLPDRPEPVSAHLEDGVAGMRIGLVTELLGDEIDPAITSRVRVAAEALAAAGAEITEVSIPSVHHALAAYRVLVNAEASSNLARYDGVRHGLRVDADTTDEMMLATRTAGFGLGVKERLLLGTHALSADHFDTHYDRARRLRTLLIRELATAFADVETLLAPTAPQVARRLGEVPDADIAWFNDHCTVPANLAGIPALSLPFGTVEGLPVGVQVMAAARGEIPMFRTAAVLEATAPTRTDRAIHGPGGDLQ